MPGAATTTRTECFEYGRATFTYTNNGELKTKTEGGQVTTYDYDALGNLRSVVLPDGVRIDYVIDGHNRRVGKKEVNGVLVPGLPLSGPAGTGGRA